MKDRVGLNPKFFLAVVEAIEDKILGTVRARVIGLHTEVKEETKTEGIKTGHLPVFSRLDSPYGSGLSSIGWWGSPPLPGSLITVFFLDGEEYQKGIYIGTLAGNPTVKATGKLGFEDPDAILPRTDQLNKKDPPFDIDEGRRPEGESYLYPRSELTKSRFDATDTDNKIDIAFESEKWYESSSVGGMPDARYYLTYQGYPRDHTKTGDSEEDILARHSTAFVIDSTPEYETFSIWHRKGSYLEFTPGGKIQCKARGGMDRIVLGGDSREYVRDNSYITVDGEEYLLIKKDKFEEFKKSVIREVTESITETIGERKVTTVPTQIHNISDAHKLDDEGNSRLINQYMLCPLLKSKHSTQSKVFCSP